MTWANMARMLEATDNLTPTQQVTQISRATGSFETNQKPFVLSILDKDKLMANNLGLAKAKKWVAKTFDVFEDEIDGLISAHGDLGEAVYYLDVSAITSVTYSPRMIYNILQYDVGSEDKFDVIEEVLNNTSANERRWFIRYLLRTPRNGINEGTVAKIIAKHYDKKLKDVKKHLNFNSIQVTLSHYEQLQEPPCNLSHGKFVAPMLAKEIPMTKWAKNVIVDYKYDGNRYQIHKSGNSVLIFNRKGKQVTDKFPEIVELVQEYEHDCILDGEIYPINRDGTPAEHKLMGTRVHSKNVTEAVSKVPVRWVIFDCLKLGTETLMDEPYSTRVDRMSILPNQAHRMPKDGDIMGFYEQAIADGFEGIIVKDSTMPYEAGKRSIGWAKYKPPQINLDVVILSAEYGQGNKSNVMASFEMGVKSDSGFTSIGKVGSGFSDSDLIRLTNTLRRYVENYSSGVYRFSPQVILEVKADLISRDEKGNIGLRFPRCVRIRDDKFVADINTLKDVEDLE